MIRKDITGMRFGKLVAKEWEPIPDHRQTAHSHYRHWWRCECDCGRTHFVITTALLRSHTKSCGCISLYQSNRFRDRNKAIIARRKATVESASQIAHHFGCTKGVVMGVLYRAGMTTNKARPTARSPKPRPTVTFPPSAHCVYPIGHPGALDFKFCGEPVWEGGNYCEAHHELVYIKGSGTLKIKI